MITKWNWTILTALAIGLAGIFSNYLSKKIDYLWMKLAWLLNFILLKVLLFIIFFMLLFPFGFLSKLFGKKDPLNLNNKADSLFTKCNKKFDKVSLEKSW